MAFSITAELPLGTYRGASVDGRPESIPSVSRLYSALLCAAGFGPRSVQRGTQMVPCEPDEAALRWLEDNPPDRIAIPALSVNTTRATAYRDDGTLKRKSKVALSVKNLQKSPDAAVAVDGHFTWTWSVDPPSDVTAVLDALCADVAYLGTSESPVRLMTSRDDAESTHLLDEHAGLFSAGGRDVELPVPGRLDELVAAHEAATGSPPSPARDRYGSDEHSSSPVPPRNAVALARYAARQPAPSDVPWPQVLLIPLDRSVPERSRVRWATAAHRALIAAIGEGAPPLITGAYPPGATRPANRIALQLLDAGDSVDLPTDATAGLAVLLPQGADSADVQTLVDALSNLSSIRGPAGAVRQIVGPARSAAGAQFWQQPAAGVIRLWRTAVPAVPDTRGADRGWTFAHAALLSLGFVWHGSARLPEQPGRGDARYRAIVGAVNDAGAAVLMAEPLRTTGVHDYVHRVNEHAVVRPYRALLSVGSLGGDQVVQAIGQSRHLGGGLLVPVDLPEGAALDLSWAGIES